jgi:hypothetical protein
MQYRKIWENAFGPIPKDENGKSYEIHHIDGDRTNNSLSNLQCVSIKDHYEIHKKQEDWAAAWIIKQRLKLNLEELESLRKEYSKIPKSLEFRQKMSQIKRGTKMTKEAKLKMSKFQKERPRKPHSEKTKAKISETIKGTKRKPWSEEIKKKISDAQKGIKRSPISEEHKAKISQARKRYEASKK